MPRPSGKKFEILLRGRRVGGDRLLDLGPEDAVEVRRGERADQLEGDLAIAADDEVLRHAVDAPLDAGAAVRVGAHGGIWIAVAAEEPARVLGRILRVPA